MKNIKAVKDITVETDSDTALGRELKEDVEDYTLRTAKSIKRAEDLLNSDVYDALRGEIYRIAEDNEYLDVCNAMLMTYDDDDSRYYYYDVADEAKAMIDAIKDANDWDDVIDEMMDFYAVAADSGVNESKVARRHTIKEAATHRRTPFSIDREGFEFDDDPIIEESTKCEGKYDMTYDDDYHGCEKEISFKPRMTLNNWR